MLQLVWIAARRSLRDVFEQVSIQQLADGTLRGVDPRQLEAVGAADRQRLGAAARSAGGRWVAGRGLQPVPAHVPAVGLQACQEALQLGAAGRRRWPRGSTQAAATTPRRSRRRCGPRAPAPRRTTRSPDRRDERALMRLVRRLVLGEAQSRYGRNTLASRTRASAAHSAAIGASPTRCGRRLCFSQYARVLSTSSRRRSRARRPGSRRTWRRVTRSPRQPFDETDQSVDWGADLLMPACASAVTVIVSPPRRKPRGGTPRHRELVVGSQAQ